MRYLEENNCRITNLDSVSELIAHARDLSVNNPRWERAMYEASNGFSASFFGRAGLDSIEHTVKCCDEVWSEGIDTIERMERSLSDLILERPVTRKRRMRFDPDSGDEVCYDRLRAGQDFWRSTKRQITRGSSCVAIVLDMTTPSRVKASDILWRGAAAIVLTKVLERSGRRVEIKSLSRSNVCYSGGVPNAMTIWTMKQTNEPLNISTLASAVSGWFYRSMVLRAKFGEHLDSTFGYLTHPTDSEIEKYVVRGDYVKIANVWSESEALALIRRKIAEINTSRAA
jgi:hypothetical protein